MANGWLDIQPPRARLNQRILAGRLERISSHRQAAGHALDEKFNMHFRAIPIKLHHLRALLIPQKARCYIIHLTTA